MKPNQILFGNCLDRMTEIKEETIDLVYFDPPFFTQKKHSLTTRDNSKLYQFDDKFDSLEEYLKLIKNVLIESKRVLKNTGSVFLHCDKTASHYIRVVLDEIFEKQNFQSEIIWSYKRWSNSKKGLLNSHQVIFFYSKSENFKFNTIYTDYSATTNIDQILQERERDATGKSIYKRDATGNVIIGKEKKGVPLSDVWEIPYLNPKAKERVGYPTQKPVLLLNQIITISTNEGDLVLDPFCGSGTTCVSAKHLKRNFIGIDKSQDAVDLALLRIEEMIITESEVLNKGSESYIEKSSEELAILETINAIAVQRNAGIDGFLKEQINGNPVPVKIQSKNESLQDAIEKLEKAVLNKNYPYKIVIQTQEKESNRLFEIQSDVEIFKSLTLQAKEKANKYITQNTQTN